MEVKLQSAVSNVPEITLCVCLQMCVLAAVDVLDAQFSHLWSNCVPVVVTRLLFCDIYGPK